MYTCIDSCTHCILQVIGIFFFYSRNILKIQRIHVSNSRKVKTLFLRLSKEQDYNLFALIVQLFCAYLGVVYYLNKNKM